MKRILKILLIIFGVIVLIYGVYLILGKPAIPLPAYRYEVYQGNQLYDIVKATGSDEVIITMVSNGEIVASANEQRLVQINFTPESLDNAVTLAVKYIELPEQYQNILNKVDRFTPRFNLFPNLARFFYHVIRFQLKLIIAAI